VGEDVVDLAGEPCPLVQGRCADLGIPSGQDLLQQRLGSIETVWSSTAGRCDSVPFDLMAAADTAIIVDASW
jgi:hypothetical protein